MANPIIFHLPLNQSLVGRNRSGSFSATVSGPLRFKKMPSSLYGAVIERTGTNYHPNPHLVGSTTGYDSVVMYGNASISPYVTATSTGTNIWTTEVMSTPSGSFSFRSRISTEDHLIMPSGTTVTTSFYKLSSIICRGYAQIDYVAEMSSGSFGGAVVPLSLVSKTVSTVAIESLDNSDILKISLSLIIADFFSDVHQGDKFHIWSPQVEITEEVSSLIPELDSQGDPALGYTWVGTPHSSASIREQTIIRIPNTELNPDKGALAFVWTVGKNINKRSTFVKIGKKEPGSSYIGFGLSEYRQVMLYTSNDNETSIELIDMSGLDIQEGDEHVVYISWDGVDIQFVIDDNLPIIGTRTIPTTSWNGIVELSTEVGDQSFRDICGYEEALSGSYNLIELFNSSGDIWSATAQVLGSLDVISYVTQL